MAKAGYSAAAQTETSLNFGEGWGEIVEIESIVHELSPNKTTGETYGAMPAVRMMIQRTDADGKATADDPIEEFMSVGSLEKFHPGIAENAQDEDPEDRGTEVGETGNCLWSDGSKINKKSKWGIFTASLDAKGFKAAVLDAGFLPDLIGLKGFFTSIALPKDADRTYKRDPKALVVDKITKFPYDKAPAKGAKGATAAAAQAAPKNGKASAPAAAAAAQAAAASDDGEVEALSTQLFVQLATNMAGQELPKTKIMGKLVGLLAKGLPDDDGKSKPVAPKLHKPIQEFWKNDAWLAEQCGTMDYAFADGVITFPAA